jgi:adenosylcobinamide kinase/adenosylcobinamide-phosphate guanylyltransferase
MLAGFGCVDYVATGAPGIDDPEWQARVAAHQQRRPARWRTVETLDLAGVLSSPDIATPVLIECLNTWLARIMDDCGVWSGGPDADGALAARTDGLVAAWRASPRRVVAVSSEVGSGIVPATASARRFCDELGQLNARIAADCEEVWLCTAGIAQRLR